MKSESSELSNISCMKENTCRALLLDSQPPKKGGREVKRRWVDARLRARKRLVFMGVLLEETVGAASKSRFIAEQAAGKRPIQPGPSR